MLLGDERRCCGFRASGDARLDVDGGCLQRLDAIDTATGKQGSHCLVRWLADISLFGPERGRPKSQSEAIDSQTGESRKPKEMACRPIKYLHKLGLFRGARADWRRRRQRGNRVFVGKVL